LEIAADAASPITKAQFEGLAKSWMRLATDLERGKRLIEQWGKAAVEAALS
jgi:hypothetical protein